MTNVYLYIECKKTNIYIQKREGQGYGANAAFKFEFRKKEGVRIMVFNAAFKFEKREGQDYGV